MSMFTDFDAMLWLVVGVVITLVVSYTLLFGIYLKVCRLDPSRAIRMALTVGFVCLIVILCFISGLHAQYLAFWSDMGLLPNFLLVVVPILGFLIVAWALLPKERAI